MVTLMMLLMVNCPDVDLPEFSLTCPEPCAAAGPGGCAEDPSDCMKQIRLWVKKARKKVKEAGNNTTPVCRAELTSLIVQISTDASTYGIGCPVCFSDGLPVDNMGQLYANFLDDHAYLSRSLAEAKIDPKELALLHLRNIKLIRSKLDEVALEIELEEQEHSEFHQYDTLQAIDALFGELEGLWNDALDALEE